MAAPDLRSGARQRPSRRAGIDRSRTLARAATRDPVRQRPRTRRPGAGARCTPACPTHHSHRRTPCWRPTTRRCARLWASLRPGLAFAADGALFERALSQRRRRHRGRDLHSALKRCEPLTSPSSRQRPRRARIDAAHARVGPDTIAKILLHVRLDWQAQGRDQHAADALCQPGDDPDGHAAPLARSRRFSATGCRGTTRSAETTTSESCCYNGGTLYIDDGKPLPMAFQTTIAQPPRDRGHGVFQRAARATTCWCHALRAERAAARRISSDG